MAQIVEQPANATVEPQEMATGGGDLPNESGEGPAFFVTAGGSYWEGEFGGDTTTRISTALINLRYRLGNLRLDATVPYMDIRSRGMVFSGVNGTPLVVAPGEQALPRHRHGLADVSVGASWAATAQEDAGVDLDLSARVKIPSSSDASGLSTGETDAYVGMEVSRSFGIVTPSGRIGYRFFGDPTGWDIRDGFAASAELVGEIAPASFVSLSYDYAQRTSRFIQDSHAVVLGASAPLAARLRLTGYASAGLSSGAADYAGGASLTFDFGRR